MAYNRIQIRRDTEANWILNNPKLSLAELSYNSTNKEIALGTGIDSYTSLNYLNKDKLLVIGSVIAWIPGYYTNGSNAGFTSTGLSLSDNWKECNGSECNDSDSPIFNGVNRFLPNLTEDRFLMGGTSPGNSGGSDTMADHTHICADDSPRHIHIVDGGIHRHKVYYSTFIFSAGTNETRGYQSNQGVGYENVEYTSHVHNCGNATNDHVHIIGSGDVPSSINNIPKYLTCKYIMRIK